MVSFRNNLEKMVFILLFLYSCCPPFCPPNPPQPSPELGLKIVDVSNPTPEIDETVIIRWDYDHPELLKIQAIRLISLLIDGNLFQEVQGCLPDGIRPEGIPDTYPCLPLNQRAVSFPFRGPVAVSIIGINEDNKVFEKVVKLKLAGMLFKVNDMSFGVPGYPRFGSPGAQRIQNYEFDKAFGVYEEFLSDQAEDGKVNHFAQYPYTQIFAAGSPFFGSSNSPLERNNFDFIRGSSFPTLDPGFLDSEEGNQFWANRTHADGLLYAGTLVINGTREEIKTPRGNIVVITPTSGGFETFYIQIDIRSTDDIPSRLLISDIHAGNPVQGLVLSTFRGHISSTGMPATTGEYLILMDNSGFPIGKCSGYVKNAVVGHNVTTTNEIYYLPAQGILNVEWANIPFYPDTDISGLYDDQFVQPQ